MKRILLIIGLFTALCSVASGNSYENMSKRAERSFDWKEWSSAGAMYQLMLAQRPDSLSTYGHAIVAAQMLDDTTAAVDLVERAMAQGIGLADVLASVKTIDFSIGEGDRYGIFLHVLRQSLPWMSRGLDNELLRYYTFRHDGPMMVKYARIMLDGLPDSPVYLAALAQGLMLSGREYEAALAWERLLTIDPENYDALIQLGTWYRSNGHPDRARALLQRARNIKATPELDRLASF